MQRGSRLLGLLEQGWLCVVFAILYGLIIKFRTKIQANCTKAENCRFTGYTDCCATMKTCSECVAQPKCGFCEDQQRCTPGAANGTLYPGNGCSGENDYYYDRCPDTSVPAATIIFGIVLALGCGVVITGMTLLGLYFRQLYAKNSARAQLERYYLKVRPVCAFCADFYAVVQCNTCHGQFCKTCADLHAQELEDHISTPINMYDSVKRYTSFPEEQ